MIFFFNKYKCLKKKNHLNYGTPVNYRSETGRRGLQQVSRLVGIGVAGRIFQKFLFFIFLTALILQKLFLDPLKDTEKDEDFRLGFMLLILLLQPEKNI